MTGLDIRGAWTPLDESNAARVEAAVGVFELRRDGETFLIEHAGATTPWGLRGALVEAAAQHGAGVEFRSEVNSAYLSRWSELMSVHRSRTGSFPTGNGDRVPTIGRIGGQP